MESGARDGAAMGGVSGWTEVQLQRGRVEEPTSEQRSPSRPFLASDIRCFRAVRAVGRAVDSCAVVRLGPPLSGTGCSVHRQLSPYASRPPPVAADGGDGERSEQPSRCYVHAGQLPVG